MTRLLGSDGRATVKSSSQTWALKSLTKQTLQRCNLWDWKVSVGYKMHVSGAGKFSCLHVGFLCLLFLVEFFF